MLASVALSGLLALAAHAQSTSTLVFSTNTAPSASVPTGSYASYASQITLTGATTSSPYANATTARNGTVTASSQSTSTSNSVILVGSARSSASSNGTASQTSTAVAPVNTQPCNGYPEFCSRKYSNITQVCAHNSAFVKPGNAASNQDYSIISQLNDGIRMSEFFGTSSARHH